MVFRGTFALWAALAPDGIHNPVVKNSAANPHPSFVVEILIATLLFTPQVKRELNPASPGT